MPSPDKPPTDEAGLLEERVRITKLLPGSMRDDSAIREMEAALKRLRQPRLAYVNLSNVSKPETRDDN